MYLFYTYIYKQPYLEMLHTSAFITLILKCLMRRSIKTEPQKDIDN